MYFSHLAKLWEDFPQLVPGLMVVEGIHPKASVEESWTFRQSRRSTISPETQKALIITEGLHDTAAQDIQTLLTILAENIAAIWSPPHDMSILTADQPRLEF